MKFKFLFLILFVISSGYSQRFKILEGELENLKNINSFNAEFNYENIEVHGFKSEEEFLKEKMEKRNADPGKAEEFRANWFSNREKYYNPAFIDYFNKYFKNQECKIASEAAHLMKVNLTWIYTGYAVEPAKLSTVIDFYDVNNPSKKLLSIQFDKVIGLEKKMIAVNEHDRIIGAFEKLAKNLAIQLKRFH
ncbi:hypothetical protein [Flavobacterium sp. H122]|uniref:hypothetical protein n=1 Tax=Flavobacterium sp. H122 TaxID=2529860 RepID=UPI0010A9CD06|nr:hypothetical protein [Flavobacterium sp. H122]